MRDPLIQAQTALRGFYNPHLGAMDYAVLSAAQVAVSEALARHDGVMRVVRAAGALKQVRDDYNTAVAAGNNEVAAEAKDIRERAQAHLFRCLADVAELEPKQDLQPKAKAEVAHGPGPWLRTLLTSWPRTPVAS